MPRTGDPLVASACWPVIAAVVLHLGLLGLYVSKYGGDVSALVGASHEAARRPPLEKVTTSIGPGGYDGMFYFTIARNPWKRHLQGLDAPGFRHARLLYPLLCWLLSGGNPSLLLWVMPLVNLAGIAGLAWLGAWLALRHDLSAWWGFVLPLVLNACIPALRDLTDVIGVLAVLGLLAAWLMDGNALLLLFLAAAAVFAREQNVALVGIVLLGAARSRRPALAAGLVVVVVIWLAWLGLLTAWYGRFPFHSDPKVFCLTPLTGWCAAWGQLGGWQHSTRLAVLNCLSLSHVALMTAAALYAYFLPGSRSVVLMLLVAVALGVFAGANIWCDLIGYRRALIWLPLGIWLVGIQTRKTWLLYLLVPGGLFSLVAALRYV